MSRPPIEHGDDYFVYLEKNFGRSSLTAAAPGVGADHAAKAAVPGNDVTQVIQMTPASMSRLNPDLIIVYPNNAKGVIASVNTGTQQVTVNSITNLGLPAVTAGDVFAVLSTIKGDGMNYFSNYSRMETIQRYNYVQFFLRAQRWARLELIKHENMGRTNYLSLDKEEKLDQLRVDMFNAYWNGERGEYTISNGIVAKAMGGVVPTMINAGSLQVSTSLAGLRDSFTAAGFATNYKRAGATRFVYGTDEMLFELYKAFGKQDLVRYTPNDMVANMNLDTLVIGTMRFVMVNVELFRESSCFPADWRRKLIVLDQESITPVKIRRIPQYEMGQTIDLTSQPGRSTREDYVDFWCQSQLSMEYNNPLGGFIVNVL